LAQLIAIPPSLHIFICLLKEDLSMGQYCNPNHCFFT
jgi:hypothetical protein